MLRIRLASTLRDINVLNYRHFGSSLRNEARIVDAESDPKTYKSHVKTKLNYFLETGQVLKYSPGQFQKRINKIKEKLSYKVNQGSYSLQKALLVLRSKYDNILQTDSGEIISTEKLNPSDLNINSQKSLNIFKSLVNIRKINRKPMDEKLILKLLGTNSVQIKDPFLVTRDVLKLLERDREITRAVYLAKLSGSQGGVVGMNAVLQWLLERGETKAAFKNFQDRKKWGIPITEHTYIIFFDGLAKAHEWGKVSNEMAEKCMQIFESLREISNKEKESSETKFDKNKTSKCTIAHFNACLSLLMKNFKNDQQYAWSFFDQLLPDSTGTNSALVADSQTFTIFLNGIKKYSYHKSELIINNEKLTKQIKTLSLLQIQGRLIQTADLILDKIIAAATPPIPPTKEEVEENPDCLTNYRQKLKRQLVDIDQTFVSVFISCFINNNTGTGLDINSGSHYKYIQRGLKYLSLWCPDVESLFHFVEKASDETSVLLKPNDSLKINTDSRVKNAIETYEESSFRFLEEGETINDVLPQTLLPSDQLERSKVNPLVIFPPSLLSHNKTKAIFSGKQKRLVDFTRPSFADVRLVSLDRQYRNSKGKFGKKLSDSTKISLNKKNGINRFVLMQTLDGLLQLGKLKEFYLAVWYSLTKWGGIYVSRTDILKIANIHGVSKGVLSENYFPKFISPELSDSTQKIISSDTGTQHDFVDTSPENKLDLTPEHVSETVDIMLVENFIFKISKNFNKEKPSSMATEIFASLVNPSTNISKSLNPRPKTIDSIFSIFMKELHHYNDSNYNREFIDKRQKNIPNNTPKKSITGPQLQVILASLIRFMDCLMIHETRGQRKKSLVSNDYVESYNRIIERLYRSTWSSVETPDELNYHKKIIKSGILLYRPRHLIDNREKIVFSEPILKSMEIVYDTLKNSQSLDKKDVKLMLSLKLIFQLKSDDETALEKLNSYAKNCYLSIS